MPESKPKPKLTIIKHPYLEMYGEGKQLDHDILMEKLNSIYNYYIEYDNDECAYNFLLANALNKIIEAKQLFVAWSDEEI